MIVISHLVLNDMIKLKGEIDSVMIVAPKGVYDNWIKQEIPNHLPEEFERFVVKDFFIALH